MPSLRAYNHIECIHFNAGPIPDAETLIDRWPKRGKRKLPLPVEEAPEDTENRLAWIINCYGQHYAGSWKYHRFQQIPVPEMETWVVGKPRSGDTKLAAWFDDMPDSYRLLFHRAPPAYRGREHPASRAWNTAYENLKFKTGRPVSDDMRGSVRGVLDELLEQYSVDHGDPRAVIELLGHEYGYSNAIAYK